MRAMSPSLSACPKLGMTTPGMPSSASMPCSTTSMKFDGSGKIQCAVEREVRPHRQGRARVVVARGAGGHVKTRIGIGLLPGAERRVRHGARDRRTGRGCALGGMVDVGKIERDGLHIRWRKRGEAMHDRRHRARRRPVQIAHAIAQIRDELPLGPRRGIGIGGGQGRRDPVVDRGARRRHRRPFRRRGGCAACGRRRSGSVLPRDRRRGSIRRSCWHPARSGRAGRTASASPPADSGH